MVVLGIVVGPGPTAFDDAALRILQRVFGPEPHWMLYFSWALPMMVTLAVAVLIALVRRRWRLAMVVALCPVLSVVIVRLLKPLFGRYKGDALAYPGGHTNVVITVMAMLVLAAGVSLWLMLVAGVVTVIGALSMAATDLHFLTDNIGAALFASAMVCLAVLAAGPQAESRAAARPAALPENTQPPRNVPSRDR
ncbi:PA-phosphatase [Mycobacterium adipatum]|uniref:PA-phosphatase n=1 Tax=Mycobacterium adipatum TaxID=1682113 RepID=UPI0034E0B9C9